MLRYTSFVLAAFVLSLSSCLKPASVHTVRWSLSDNDAKGDSLIARVATEESGRGIYAILWIANDIGPSMGGSRLEIHHHRIRPSTIGRSVYALQRDYSLRSLPLSEEEKEKVFTGVLDLGKHNGREFASESPWKEKIFPELQRIPPP